MLKTLIAAVLLATASICWPADLATANRAFATGDYQKALAEWRVLAEQGNAIAQYQLGDAYANATGVTMNKDEAVGWFRKSAAQGYPEAQYMLGVAYKIGFGVKPDPAESLAWLEKAAAQGHAKAKSDLVRAQASAQPKPASPAKAEAPYKLAWKTQTLRPPEQGKIEVVEVFSYVCSECRTIAPAVEQWVARQKSDIRFERIALQIQTERTGNLPYTKAFFAAKSQGIAGKTHAAVFRALLSGELPMYSAKAADAITSVGRWYAQFGTDPQAFTALMNSPAVQNEIALTEKWVSTVNVRAVPSFVVNGRYSVSANAQHGTSTLLETVDRLVEAERAARK